MLHCLDAVIGMRTIAADSIHLTVTSPPFDNLRDFQGAASKFNFQAIAEELYRVTVPGGVVCWHVQEQIEDGSESGTSSVQRLYFKEVGFSLYNTLVIHTTAMNRGSLGGHRYGSAVQFVFVLVKGRKPRVFHQIQDLKNKSRNVGRTKKVTLRNHDGEIVRPMKTFAYSNRYWRPRTNIWKIGGSPTQDKEVLQAAHGAVMHERLAEDLIISWSDKSDIVLDPMAGLGTTWKMAAIQKRCFVGFELVPGYCEVARERVGKVK